MYYTADLHTHSRFADKCSPALCLETMYQWAQIKGINVISTGDFTHPAWLRELQEKLIPDGNGFYQLKEPPQTDVLPGIRPAQKPVRFCLSTEISCEYIHLGKERRIHHLVYAPDFETVAQINQQLSKYTDLSLNGRPSITLSSRNLLELITSISEKAFLVPAHAWTPWYSLFGSKNGYDSLKDCFQDLTPLVFALETGLSSDPPMNRRCSELDGIALLSSSDAHSLEKLGREVNRFETVLSYDDMFDAIQSGKGFEGTYEAFPEKGKYSHDGHRKCNIRWSPDEAIQHKNICPVCGNEITIGAFHRVDLLCDRTPPQQPDHAAGFEYIIALPEILAEMNGVGVKTKKVNAAFVKAINFGGNEFNVLRAMPVEDIRTWNALLGEAIHRMRAGQVYRQAGYDGIYGSIRLFQNDLDRPNKNQQGSLF